MGFKALVRDEPFVESEPPQNEEVTTNEKARRFRRAFTTNVEETLEGELAAQTPHARRLELGDAPAGRAGAARGVVCVLQDERLALQDGALVRSVEEIARHREADALRKVEVLREAEVELVDVVEADFADRSEHHVDRAGVQAGNGLAQRGGVSLPAGEARAEGDVPRCDIKSGHVELPLRADEVIAERAGAG